MAQEILIFDRSYTGRGTINQYSAVKMYTSNGVCVASGDGEASLGVVQNGAGGVPGTPGTVSSGAACDVRINGLTKFQVGSGAAVTAGDMVSADADGNAQTADTGDYVLGFCEQGGATGTLASVLLLPIGKI